MITNKIRTDRRLAVSYVAGRQLLSHEKYAGAIENNLWHHLEKYVVPAAMLLVTGVIGTVPAVAPVLAALMVIEMVILLFGGLDIQASGG